MADYSSNYVFKEFARDRNEFLRIIKSSKRAKQFINKFGYSLKKIPKDAIEIDRGREGNWNDYVKKFEGKNVKKGENWYEYRLHVYKLRRIHKPDLKRDSDIKAKTIRKFYQPTWRGDEKGSKI